MADKIPSEVLEQLISDDFMKQCCICGSSNRQFHHHFEYGRKAINEAWCILPLCHKHHQDVRNIQYKELLDWIMYHRATQDELDRYSNVTNHKKRRDWLDSKFGDYSPRKIKQHYANIYSKDSASIN